MTIHAERSVSCGPRVPVLSRSMKPLGLGPCTRVLCRRASPPAPSPRSASSRCSASDTAAGPEPTAVTSDQWLTDAETVLARVDSYSALFHKRERIGSELLPDEVVRLLFKRPFKVRLQWTSGPLQGRDVIYAEGWNGNRVRVREKGILGILPAEPRPPRRPRHEEQPPLDPRVGPGPARRAHRTNLRRGRAAGELDGARPRH